MIIIDIETKEGERALELGPNEKELKAPSNWKDKDKIKAKEAENRRKWVDRLALDHRTSEIVGGTALVIREGEKPTLHASIVADRMNFLARLDKIGALEVLTKRGIDFELMRYDAEYEVLRLLWLLIEQDLREAGFVSGFNLLQFDLPALILRGGFAGLEGFPLGWESLSPWRRYTDTRVLDWANVLSAQGRLDTTGWSLARYCLFFELENRPHGKGEEYPKKYRDGDWTWCLEHQIRDVLPILELHERFAGAA